MFGVDRVRRMLGPHVRNHLYECAVLTAAVRGVSDVQWAAYPHAGMAYKTSESYIISICTE